MAGPGAGLVVGLEVGVGVVRWAGVSVLEFRVSVAGRPAAVGVDGLLVVPMLPAGCGAPDVVCLRLPTVAVVSLVTSTKENVMTVNISSPDSDTHAL